MTFEKIKSLLDKYFESETSLDEEAQLFEYFNSPEIDNRLANYKPLFQFFKAEKVLILDEIATKKVLSVEKQPKKLFILSRNGVMTIKASRGGNVWLKAVAAMVILTLGSFFLIKTLYKPKDIGLAENSRVTIYDEKDDPQKAFEEVQAALKLVSKKMKKGQHEAEEGLRKVKKATQDVNKVIKIHE